MACKYKYKDKWYSEEEVRKEISKDTSVDQVLTEFLSSMSYTIEINTAKDASEKAKKDSWSRAVEQGLNPWEEGIDNDFQGEPTQHYSNLTVPGGTNYTENEIATPGQLVEKKPQGVSVKQGVSELFESNPELANSVYEALGFKLKTSENEITRGIKEVLPYKVIGDYSNIEEGLIGRKQYETKIGDDTYVFEISNYNYENEDGTYQSYYDIDFTVNGSEELVGTGFFDKSEKAKQIIQALISQNFGNDTIRFNVEESKKGKQRLLLYKRLMNQLGYNPSDEMEYALFYNANLYISPSDRIIFGHPTIGKSYLKKQGEERFITLDDDYANEVNAFVDANRGSETRQEYKGRKPKEYNEFMLNLYDRLKLKARREGKILFVSNTNILKERMSDFDKVITMPKEEFKKRFDARGATYGFEDWKSDIDATVAKVPSNKVISTTGYLSDLFEFSRKINLTPQQKQQAQQIYSQYLDTIFPDSTMKDIVYHGTDKEFTEFVKGKEIIPKGKTKGGIWFTDFDNADWVYKEEGGKVVAALINLKNPIEYSTDRFFDEQYGDNLPIKPLKEGQWKDVQKLLDNKNGDGLLLDIFDATTAGDIGEFTKQQVVFEPEQIHILGSKQDIEGLKSFIKSNTKTVRKGAITPNIKGHAQFSTDNGIGWFRSDEQDNLKRKPAASINEVPNTFSGVNNYTVIKTKDGWIFKHPNQEDILETNEKEVLDAYNYGSQEWVKESKTRRILEIQSDLYQKGRNLGDIEQIIKDLQKSGDLKIDCN